MEMIMSAGVVLPDLQLTGVSMLVHQPTPMQPVEASSRGVSPRC